MNDLNNIPVIFAPEKSIVVPINKIDKFLDRHPQYVENDGDWRTEEYYSFAQG